MVASPSETELSDQYIAAVPLRLFQYVVLLSALAMAHQYRIYRPIQATL
jgi:hypothetical protein